MRGPLLRRRPEQALEAACRDVEATVSRVSRIVLHASALADRLDAGAAVTGPLGPVQAGHLRVLRDAADSGRRVVQQLALAADERPGGR